MTLTRREFLLKSGTLGAAGVALRRFGMVNALAQSGGYQALVCIFLFGGNDSNNMIVPIDDYASYDAVRGTATGLNIARETLLPITPPSAGCTFGLHPSLAGLQSVWDQQRLAVVCNVGPLVEPINRSQYSERRGRHSHQPVLALGPAGAVANVCIDRPERDGVGRAYGRSPRLQRHVSADGDGGWTDPVYRGDRRPAARTDAWTGVRAERLHWSLRTLTARSLSNPAPAGYRSAPHPERERHDVDGRGEQCVAVGTAGARHGLSDHLAGQPAQRSGAAPAVESDDARTVAAAVLLFARRVRHAQRAAHGAGEPADTVGQRIGGLRRGDRRRSGCRNR